METFETQAHLSDWWNRKPSIILAPSNFIVHWNMKKHLSQLSIVHYNSSKYTSWRRTVKLKRETVETRNYMTCIYAVAIASSTVVQSYITKISVTSFVVMMLIMMMMMMMLWWWCYDDDDDDVMMMMLWWWWWWWWCYDDDVMMMMTTMMMMLWWW